MKKTGKRQLRGEALERRIEAVIRELAAEAKRAGESFTYNATKVAGQVPTTRKTLRAHDDLVEKVIADLDARRRMVDGNATVEHLREQNARLKEQIEEREKTILALRSHCANIYERLHANSIEAAHLIRPIVEAESTNAGHCILCGGEAPTSSRQSNVVPLKERK
jgi:predicted RNase H-like nuclease (RuvC/YqgF family)